MHNTRVKSCWGFIKTESTRQGWEVVSYPDPSRFFRVGAEQRRRNSRFLIKIHQINLYPLDVIAELVILVGYKQHNFCCECMTVMSQGVQEQAADGGEPPPDVFHCTRKG